MNEEASGIDAYIQARCEQLDEIASERRAVLESLAAAVIEHPRLVFVCTHNSRRSQLAQIWAWVAARIQGLDQVQCHSAGTERAAFAPPAIAALMRTGLQVRTGDGANPEIEIRVPGREETLVCSSKVLGSETLPAADFCAIMTCAQADADCPVVPGAAKRISLPYDDPKVADGKRNETTLYDERCAQIAREMFFTFDLVGTSRP